MAQFENIEQAGARCGASTSWRRSADFSPHPAKGGQGVSEDFSTAGVVPPKRPEGRAPLGRPGTGDHFRMHWARGLKGTLSWLAGWFLMLAGWSVAGVELVAGPEVEAGTNRATVRWSLDTAAGGRLRYGTEVRRLDSRGQSPVGTNHAVVLEGLRPATRYHFTVGTARGVLATNSFTTLGGSPAAPPDSGRRTNSTPAIDSGSTPAGAPPTATLVAPPARVTWGSLRSLQDHFDRHGRDFGAKDPEDYARQAWLFLQRGKREGLPAKRDEEGVLRVFDPKTRAFGAYNRDETTKTYFKPGRRGYFENQPGKPVDLKSLPNVGNSRKEN